MNKKTQPVSLLSTNLRFLALWLASKIDYELVQLLSAEAFAVFHLKFLNLPELRTDKSVQFRKQATLSRTRILVFVFQLIDETFSKGRTQKRRRLIQRRRYRQPITHALFRLRSSPTEREVFCVKKTPQRSWLFIQRI